MRGTAVILTVLAAFILGCPVTGCSCSPPPPQFHIYSQVTTAAGDAAAGSAVNVRVTSPGCLTNALAPFSTTTDGAGMYRTETFDGIYAGLCIVVEAFASGTPGGTPGTTVTKEIAAAVTSDDSARVDVRLP